MSASDPTAPAADPVRLLTVCTGNICRSPYAAALLEDGLAWARPEAFEVTSAGTHALVGRPVDPGSRRLLDAHDVRAPSAPARLLGARDIERQAMVLAMSDQHRSLVLDAAPSAHRRTVGLLDLAAALGSVGQRYSWPDLLADAGAKEVRGRWRTLPELLAALDAMPGRVTEIEDPYGRGADVFARMGRQIDAAVRTIVLWEAQFPR